MDDEVLDDPPRPGDARGRWRSAGAGLGAGEALGLAAWVLAGALGAWGLAAQSRREPYPPANAFVDAWRAGDREAMFARVGPQWRAEPGPGGEAPGRPAFDAWLDDAQSRLGALREARLVDYRDRSGRAARRGGPESIRLLFEARFDRGWALVAVLALRDGRGRWAVEGVDVEAPGEGTEPWRP